MTDEKKREILATLIGEPEEPNVLAAYMNIAAEKILNRMYPFRTGNEGYTVPPKYEQIQFKIAVYLINKRGAEGQIQHIENGVHRNYGDADIPESMLNDIVPFAQVIR